MTTCSFSMSSYPSGDGGCMSLSVCHYLSSCSSSKHYTGKLSIGVEIRYLPNKSSLYFQHTGVAEGRDDLVPEG